jgi:DNA-nicking Smr family endonuclease
MSDNADWAAPAAGARQGRRRLTPEEEHLWSLVSRGVRPLRNVKKAVPAARYHPIGPGSKPAIIGARNAAKPAVKPQGGRPTGLKPALAPVPGAGGTTLGAGAPSGTAVPPVAIARRDVMHLSRGRAAIDARIDLHGMTQVEAHQALLRFLERCQACGAKFALVITGKGAPATPSGDRGVLRRQVPLWLGLEEFRGYVLGFGIAKAGHGGEGALYVRLRKSHRRLK